MRGASRSGLTLVETLVAMAVLSLLGLSLLRTYDICRQAYAVSTGRMEVQHKARITLQRVTPLLFSAIPPSESAPALVSPSVAAGPVSTIIYNVPVQPVDVRNPTYRQERIWFTAPAPAVGQPGRLTVDPNTPGYSNDDRVLVEQVQLVSFQVLSDRAVRVTVEAWSPWNPWTPSKPNALPDHTYTLQTVVQLPFYATR